MSSCPCSYVGSVNKAFKIQHRFVQGHPQVELRMSNNTVNVRTCSDSCSALLQLIQYIAADGDLVPRYEQEEPDAVKTPSVRTRIEMLQNGLGFRILFHRALYYQSLTCS